MRSSRQRGGVNKSCRSGRLAVWLAGWLGLAIGLGALGLGALGLGFSARAAELPLKPEPVGSSVAATSPIPGVAAAEAISQITGIAISPALGVASVGVWKYYHTPASRRAALPWWSQPWFWAPALTLVLLVFFKDALGPVTPKALKKPLDALELFENKFSALIATGAIIPLAWSIFQSVAPAGPTFTGTGAAAVDFGPLMGIFGVPLALVAYTAVFLVSHVIQVMILMSPFGTVDAVLKAARLFLLSSVAATSLASPTLGAVWSGVIILACLPLAGWAFRWLTFGHVFAWDLTTFHRLRCLPMETDNRVFLSQKLGKVPRRTFGTLGRLESGELVFKYRTWPFLVLRTERLPEARYAIGRGLLHPELLQLKGSAREEELVEILDFPPRYSGHEVLLGQAYGLREIREVGLRAMWAWIRDRVGGASVAPAREVTPVPVSSM